MRRFLLGLLITFLLPMMLAASNTRILKASESVIRILTVLSDGKMVSGTAFCINDDGYFLTNAHVVDGAKSVHALKSSGSFDVDVVVRDDTIDLAILKISGAGLEPLTFATRDKIKVTDRVASIGFPGAADNNENMDELTTVTINSGIIGKFGKTNLSIKNRKSGPMSPIVQHDAAVNHGNSGGPLVNECGLVVGINVQKGLDPNRSLGQIVSGDVVQGIFYAIDVDLAKKLLGDRGVSYLETDAECTAGGSIPSGTVQGGSSGMSDKDRKYLIVGMILLLLLAIWGAVVYLQGSRGKQIAQKGSEISRIVSRKLHEKEAVGAISNPGASVTVQLTPAAPGLPVLTVDRTEKIVGRSRSAALHLDNPLVSGKHLSLTLSSNNEVVVKDLGSSNGTYIEGRKLTPHTPYTLKRGERLVIGSEDVVYRIE